VLINPLTMSMHISIDCDPWTGGVDGAVKLLTAIQNEYDIKGRITRQQFGIATLSIYKINPAVVDEVTDHIKSLYPGSIRGAQWRLK
jgi:hypothetical protein